MVVKAIIALVVVLFSIIVHEVAHGLVALWLGDDTAQRSGRLSLNPLRHIDLTGTIILPLLFYFSKVGFIFGWAKPVPVDYNKLSKNKFYLCLTAAAGIIANMILAIGGVIGLRIAFELGYREIGNMAVGVCFQVVLINVVLAVFNFLPIPPLDGSKILLGWSENKWVKKYLQMESFGLALTVFLIFILPAGLTAFGIDFNPLISLVKFVVNGLIKLIL